MAENPSISISSAILVVANILIAANLSWSLQTGEDSVDFSTSFLSWVQVIVWIKNIWTVFWMREPKLLI